MTTALICNVEPFRYQATPQLSDGGQGASANQINEQALEDYLARMRESLCADIQTLLDREVDVEISFLELTDTPDSYAGEAGNPVVVNGAETGLEFGEFPTPEPDRPDISTRLVSLIKPNNGTALGGASISTVGVSLVVVGGSTASHVAPTGTDPLASVYRYRVNGANSLNSTASIRHNVGLVVGAGGWRVVARWGMGTALTNTRFFAGVINQTGAIANVDPSTLINLVGVAFDSGDTNLHVMHNDGAGGATDIDLGASFPKDTTSFYEAEFVMEPASGVVTYRVLNIGTGAQATGTINSELPADTQILNDYIWANSGASSGIQSLDFHCLYLETSQ